MRHGWCELVGRSVADHLKSESCTNALRTALPRQQSGSSPIVLGQRGVQPPLWNLTASWRGAASTADEPPGQVPGDLIDQESLGVGQERDASIRPFLAGAADYVEVFRSRQRLHSSDLRLYLG